MMKTKAFWLTGVLLSIISSSGCGSHPLPVPATVSVSVSPSNSSVLLGNTQQFTATVAGTSNDGVLWSVNGVSGGNSIFGTINSTGLYTATQRM
jgi:hypothetical protein